MQPFEAIVAEHGPVVMRVCRALLGPVEADDAWSETFLAALRAYPGLRPGSNVRGWLVTIAHNKAIDQTPGPGTGAGSGRRPPEEPPSRRSGPGAARHRTARRPGGAARQAAGSGRVPLPGRPLLRRGRQRCWNAASRPPGATPRTASPPSAGTTRRNCDESEQMPTDSQIIHDLMASPPGQDDATLARAAGPAGRTGRRRRAPRRRLPHDGQPGRLAAPGGHAGRPRPGGVRGRESRRRAGGAVEHRQPPDPPLPAGRRRRGPSSSTSTSPAGAGCSRYRSTCSCPRGSGGPC